MKRVSRSAIVDRPAAELFAIVEDIEAYPQFLPWCAATQVHARSDGRTRATLTIGMRGIRQSFTTDNLNRPHESIEMQLVSGPFRRFGARWLFHALTPDATRIEFNLEYEFASRLVARALEPLFDRIADSMVDAFVTRALSGRGRGAD